MVIKGGSRSGGGDLAAHLLRTDTNERAEVMELRGVLADRLPGELGDQLAEALREMEAVATGTRCRKPLYHASINTGPGEELTAEQKAAAVARLELALGLEGHARAVIEHRKEGRDHLHIVWSRIDVDTMRAARDSHNYRKHEEVARELEREFGHNRVQGAHVERDGPEGERRPRPARTPSPAAVQQATRTKRSLGDVGADLTRLWRAADTGPAFAAALDGAGYVLAQGDRRGFVVIDREGGVHSLARRIEGASTREVNARLAGVELGSRPTVDQARAMQRDRALSATERPAARLADELTRPADERAERSADQARREARDDATRQQIRADLDQHLRDQAGGPSSAPETARREAGRSPAPDTPGRPADRAQPSPEGPRRSPEDDRRAWADQLRGFGREADAAGTAANDPAPERERSRNPEDERRSWAEMLKALDSEPTRRPDKEAARPPPSRDPPPADRRAGPDAAQQRADSREYRREREKMEQPRPATPRREKSERPSRATTAAGAAGAALDKGADGLIGLLGRVLGAAGRVLDGAAGGSAGRQDDPPREEERPKENPAPPAPSRERERERDRDRSSFEARPAIRMAAGFGIGIDTTWIAEAKRRLIAYSDRTGMAIIEQLNELENILHRALYGPA